MMYLTRAFGVARRSLPGAFLGLLMAVTAAEAQTGSVRGQVLSEDRGVPLHAAVVEVVGVGRLIAAKADAGGGYELREVPAGRRVIRTRHIGHAPLEIEVVVPAGGVVRLDLSLRLAPVALEPVDVAAGRATSGIDTAAARGSELGLAGARALRSSPGIAEIGLADVVQGTPGQDPPDPTDVLYVRGAAADLKLVYLDGAPVYAPFPLGGIVDAFVPDVLRSATVFLGGAPARYDGGLSYIMDLQTRGVRSDGFHSSGAVDLLSGRLMVETPLAPGMAVLAAGRAVHGAGAIQPVPYGYREGLLRLDAALPGRMHVHVTGFGNDEEVWLEEAARHDSVISWGNRAWSLRLATAFLGGDLEITASSGTYRARLPLEGRVPAMAAGSAKRERLAADLSRGNGDLLVRYGGSIDRLSNRYQAELRDGSEVAAQIAGGAVGAYGDVAWQASDRVRLRGGLRADHFSAEGRLVFAPRVAVTLLATDRAAVTAAAGQYHQYLRAPDAAVLFETTDSAAPPIPPLSVAGSSHVTVALDQELSDGVRMGVEGFFKSFDGIPAAPSAEASSSGVDLWLRRDRGRWTGWAGYSLAWAWAMTGEAATDRFAGRHLISAGVGAPLAPDARFEARFAYGAGLPYAAIPMAFTNAESPTSAAGYETRNADALTGRLDSAPLVPSPDQPYLRLDLSATHTLSREWGGRSVRLDSYLKLLNTLGSRDALFYRYERDRAGSLTPLAVLPLVPVLGLEWRF